MKDVDPLKYQMRTKTPHDDPWNDIWSHNLVKRNNFRTYLSRAEEYVMSSWLTVDDSMQYRFVPW